MNRLCRLLALCGFLLSAAGCEADPPASRRFTLTTWRGGGNTSKQVLTVDSLSFRHADAYAARDVETGRHLLVPRACAILEEIP